LALALIPLAFSLVQSSDTEASLEERIDKTVENAPPEVQEKVEALAKSKTATIEDLLQALPDQRIEGALLARKTWMHWAFAGLSAIVFFVLILLIASHDADLIPLLGIGLFTATLGILFLFIVQFLAEWTQGVVVIGRSILVILFYIAKFIGFSYRAASDPDANFFLSFLGFTCGVGFCEEVCKALPLLWHFRRASSLTWRGAFIWGLASGAGFGIAEGIIYSSTFYNGIDTGGMYVVRFVSCVALHAVWTGSVAITFYRCQGLFQEDISWYEYFPRIIRVVGIAMVLHGLYDTLLKMSLNAPALGVAVVSFLWLAWQINQVQKAEGPAAEELTT
jgi:RsiW-degrading membrane proteinase PrsW (M82 family)